MASSIPETPRLSAIRERSRAPLALVATGLLALVAGGVALGSSEVHVTLVPTLVVVALGALAVLAVVQRSVRRSLAAENERLTAAAARATLELRASRARIAASAERERRRIERDLHDGAQQRLVALRIELELAEELVAHDPALATARLRELEREVDDALEELRALAHGVYPPLLADRGLAEALHAHVAHAALPVDLRASGVGRYAPEVESAVYFCVLEAVQNACKHAVGTRLVRVVLDGSGGLGLRVTVVDDGTGLPAGGPVPGTGITNMHDRLAAVGGRLEIAAEPTGGCAVRFAVPDLLPVVPRTADGGRGDPAATSA
jgi:signal transduction histidine kinase